MIRGETNKLRCQVVYSSLVVFLTYSLYGLQWVSKSATISSRRRKRASTLGHDVSFVVNPKFQHTYLVVPVGETCQCHPSRWVSDSYCGEKKRDAMIWRRRLILKNVEAVRLIRQLPGYEPLHRPDPSVAQSQIGHKPVLVSIWTFVKLILSVVVIAPFLYKKRWMLVGISIVLENKKKGCVMAFFIIRQK